MPRIPEGGLSQTTASRYGGGQLRFLRRHTGPSEIFGLGAVIPVTNVTLHYGGRSVSVRAGLDTGATGSQIVVEPAVADRLKMPKLAEVEHTVVGGAKVKGYLSELDQIDIEGLPKCSIKWPSRVSVVNVGMKNHDVLIGEDYLRTVGATISYREGGVYISCGDGPVSEVWRAASGPNTLIVTLGGLIFLGFLLSLVWKD